MRRAFSFKDYRRRGAVLVITVAIHGCALYLLMYQDTRKVVSAKPEQWTVLQLIALPSLTSAEPSTNRHYPDGRPSVSAAASSSDKKPIDVSPLQANAQPATQPIVDWDEQAATSAKDAVSKMERWSRASTFDSSSGSASSRGGQDMADLRAATSTKSLLHRHRHCVKKLPYLISCSLGDEAETDRNLLDGMKNQNTGRDAVTTMETPNVKH